MPKLNGKKIRARLLAALAVAGIAALVWEAFQPNPVRVELGEVKEGPLEASIDEDGETRAVNHYLISAPVAGRLARMQLDEGDAIGAGQTVATIYPTPLDPLARKEVEEKLRAARAVVAQVRATSARAEAQLQQAARDRERAESLARTGDIAAESAERARVAETVAAKDVAAIEAQLLAAQADVRALEATLESQQTATSQPVPVRSPVSGRVLRIQEKSERVVRAGDPLVTLGNAGKLEVVIDVLSTEAVKIRPGTPARLINWGGGHAIAARVRRVEPSAFRKVSALGIEEQRVNVILDFVDPPGPLGDAYRVEAQIIVWSAAKVIKAPASALFRCGEKWCAYTIANGAARRHEVEIGHRSPLEVEVVRGLEPGTRVIVHPPNTLTEGTLVQPVP
ncbi:MAG: efflux RND transporter periplasmic adaptor subunit [Bryobacteraceae bacterium]|nr:efflux RND transporter periplasmic adaptor subunit [Bryobacteraceae bacterium]